MDELPYAPRVTKFNRPFWDELRQGRLSTTRCRKCHHITFPPKVLCPECWCRDIEWLTLAGHGHLRSYTEVCAAPQPFQPEAPYVIGLVDLIEDVRILTRIAGTYDALVPDMPVQLAIRQTTPVPLFYFNPQQEVL